MIVERHYDDEALIAILDQGMVRDPHLAVCNTCADTLASYRAIADILGEEAVWDLKELRRESTPEAVSNLRSFASRMESEDQSAAVLVDDLLARARSAWLTASQDERFVTPGVVRLLVEKSEAILDQSPPDAVAIARTAADISQRLDSPQLRGVSLRQYAFALFYTGDFVGSLDAVELAQSAFKQCAVADYDMARLGIVRAQVYSAQERFAEAHLAAKESARVFRAYGDRRRVASALGTQAYVLMRQLRYNDALPVLLDIAENYRNEIDAYMTASTMEKIATCYAETGRVADALSRYQVAEDIYVESGIESEAIRIRDQVATLLAAQGQTAEAERRLRRCIGEYQQFGMRVDAAVASISLAEILLVRGTHEEVEALCRTAIQQFRESGVPHIAEALTALTYLQEAAHEQRATAEIARHVKTYIERLPSQPQLQFAPPPPSPQ